MDSIDLLSLVKHFGQLNNVEIYGYISSRLERPVNLFNNVKIHPNGFFVKMDVLAVNLSYYASHLKEIGIYNKDDKDIYLVHGSLALLVDKNGIYPDWYATRGTIRLGSKTDDRYLQMFPFIKSGNNWGINLNILDTMDINNWSRTGRPYLSVQKSIENGFVTVPDDVMKFQRFNSQILKNQVVPTVSNNSLNSSLQTALNGVDNSKPPIEVQINQSDFIVEDRDKILPRPSVIDKVKDKLNKSKSCRESFINSLKNNYSLESSLDENVIFMIKSLRSNLRSKPHPSASTGRMLLKRYLALYPKESNYEYLGTKTGKYLIDDFEEVADFMLRGDIVSVSSKAWDLCKLAFGDANRFYVCMLGIICGVSAEKLNNTYNLCVDNDIDLVKIILNNPYLLLLIDTEYSFKEVNYLAYCVGKGSDKSLSKYRTLGMLYDYMMSSDTSSTLFTKEELINGNIGLKLTNKQYTSLKNIGTYITEHQMADVFNYISNKLTRADFYLPVQGWVKRGYNYILPAIKNDIDESIELAKLSGVFISYNFDNKEYITTFTYMNMEIFVADLLYEMGSKTRGLDHNVIDSYIDEYEQLKGFKLEEKQRKAVHLIDYYASAVTGPAGSGKTTTSDCMVYVLKKFGFNDIEYAAPTGKASKRLQEVVKQPVQTFNSKFKIFSGNSQSIVDEENNSFICEDKIYFFDEVAMTNLNLFYNVCRCLTYSNQVFFLGDICQLPPIGSGLPFKNILRFLPCVKLLVSKRSAEGSSITYNSDIINNFSNSDNWKELKDGDDFKLVPINDEVIQETTVLLCKYYLGSITQNEKLSLCKVLNKREDELVKIDNLTPDDIQVVSPVGKPTYSWGTTQMNSILQPVFNNTKGYKNTFIYVTGTTSKGVKFLIGDRVVHTDSNMYSMQWYASCKDGVFEKRYGFGITNGDVGKIVGFYPADSCEFLDEVDSKPKDFKYPDALRDDTTYVGDDKYFVVVKYFDFMSNSEFYIAYRCTTLNYDHPQSGVGKLLTGDDLSNLALFYAGTVHKMQGSQAKLIIALLGNVNFNGFLTRNMLYTEITRAEKGVYLIGSVGNNMNSQLSKARRQVANEGVCTVQELIFKGENNDK